MIEAVAKVLLVLNKASTVPPSTRDIAPRDCTHLDCTQCLGTESRQDQTPDIAAHDALQMSHALPMAAAVPVHVKENSPPHGQVAMATPRVEAPRTKVRAALFGGAETTKVLPASIRLSLVARAKQIRLNLTELSKDEFDTVINIEKAYHAEHDTPEWQNAYATFLRERMDSDHVTRVGASTEMDVKRASRETAAPSNKKRRKVAKPAPPPVPPPPSFDAVDSLLADLLASPAKAVPDDPEVYQGNLDMLSEMDLAELDSEGLHTNHLDSDSFVNAFF